MAASSSTALARNKQSASLEHLSRGENLWRALNDEYPSEELPAEQRARAQRCLNSVQDGSANELLRFFQQQWGAFLAEVPTCVRRVQDQAHCKRRWFLASAQDVIDRYVTYKLPIGDSAVVGSPMPYSIGTPPSIRTNDSDSQSEPRGADAIPKADSDDDIFSDILDEEYNETAEINLQLCYQNVPK